MSDDGIGMRVGRILMKSALGENIDVQMRPALGLDLLELLMGVDRVVIVDAMRTGRKAGQCVALDLSETVSSCQSGACAHNYGVAEVVEIARRLEPSVANARIKVIGIEAQVLDQFGTELSEVVRGSIPEAVDLSLRAAGVSEDQIVLAVEIAKEWMNWSPSAQELASG